MLKLKYRKEVKKMKKTTLDLWAYQMPCHSLTSSDMKEGVKYAVLVKRSIIDDCDYIIGSWNSVLNYMMNYLGLEIVNEYMIPFIEKER